ncbi:glycosyltransferase family 2 protein [Croceicoccus sp. F390]|uniref:Glycosyltransferase family 2 protein n=1 Tax=Croceicoccus esteveae TaxID=3075597 RepID=A0ABU2ZDK3_9SPHN|nr:glycosyltransferase family 2 protein [Croceicoccus sp. F390]MDT0574673.1 glycosyltransferase family 2 protein [Croceicoccus sp. F390]
MNILAVIPCLNEADHLGPLIDQMLADPAIGLLVVADGGSDDGSRAIVSARMADNPRLALLDNADRIQSAGINRAVARYGTGFAWFLRIDAHCIYPDDYAGILVASAARHDATAVVVPMLTHARAGFQCAVAAAQNSILGTGGSPHRHVDRGRFVDHGHHALIDLAMFRKLGGYCEAMPCNEDAELDHRQARAGGRIWLEPAAAICYFPRRTPQALWRQYLNYGIGRARNLRRHGEMPRLRQLLPVAVPLAVAAVPLALVHWIFAVPAALWIGACLAGGFVVGARAGGGWALGAGAAAAIMHLAWGSGFIREMAGRRTPVPPRYGLDPA